MDCSPKAPRTLPYIAAIALFMQTLDATILNTALPAIGKDLGQSPLSMQSAIISYVLTIAILIPVSGWLADRFGSRNIFITAISFFCIGSLACAFAPTLDLLVLFRIVQGMGGAMMMPVARLALIKAYPRSELLNVINFVTIPGLIGPIMGPLLGGWLVTYASWHWIFFINVPVGLLGLLFAKNGMPNYYEKTQPFDYRGFILFGAALFLLSLGLELSSHSIKHIQSVILSLVIGVTLLAIYVLHAKKHPAPLFDLALLKNRTFTVGVSANIFSRLGTAGLALLIPLLLQVDFGYSAEVSGYMMAPIAAAAIFAKSQATRVIAFFGYKNTLIGSTIIAAIVLFLFSFPTRQTPLYFLLVPLLIFGGINSILITAMNTLALADLTPQHTSMGNSILSVAQQISISFGIAVAASFLGIFKTSLPLTSAFHYTFICLGVITLTSTLTFFKLKQSDAKHMTAS